ncbi:MAG: tryptophan--tRNA ligase [Candidatus Magasanikbacteria bacterium RIFOXYC2_FULL_39_8]|nr:MAG: tryptophan--tRNA ligase [Candidatus Magasanikbacteria bacterium RIFOXYC2_FULL_39_8]
MNRILSALQPSGILHIGNYFGAIEPMVSLQTDSNENLLFIVDYHAITVPQDPEQLRHNILFATATYLACGIDSEKTILFQQSRVQEHTELAWILNCLAYMGEIERMTQYKDKALGKGESVSVGLFDYPILMAADILLYDTTIVPVGEDQKQHVELARDLAERFNHRFGETFAIPKPQIREQGARIMGLDDPHKKMSKSASNEKNYVSLMDDEITVLKKIKSAVTDSSSTIEYTPDRKELANLLTIYSLVTQTPIETLVHQYEGKGYGAFKTDLAQAVSAFLSPIQEKIKDLLSHPDHLLQQVDVGAKSAQSLASKKMKEIRQKIGVQL